MSGICMDCEPLSIGDVSFGVTDAATKFLNLFQDDVEYRSFVPSW